MEFRFLKTRFFRAFLLVLIGCLSTEIAQAFRGEKIKLDSQLEKSLNQILETATAIQEAFFNQDEGQIETTTRKVLGDVRQAITNTKAEKVNGLHVGKILEVVNNHIAQLLGTTGEERRKFLRLAFDQVVHIAQTYKLDSYRIFYCQPSDGIWLQKAWKAQNPYNPQTLANCGIPVR